LYEATSEKDYLYYAIENAHSLGGASWTMTEFSWDVKYAGVQVLASKVKREYLPLFLLDSDQQLYIAKHCWLSSPA
jgi:hypothetical protein